MSAVDVTTLLEYQLRAFLLADPDIAALVGNRIYPAPAPQNSAMPFVTFQRISTDREYSIYGRSGLAGVMVQIDCWSDAPEYAGRYGTAKQIAETIRLPLESFRGMWGSLRIQEVTISSERDLFEGQDRTRRVSIDYRIWHDEQRGLGPVPPSYAGPLDKVPGAIFGYSTRLLRAGYAGAANQIRRATDPNTIMTGIGFAADGSYDTAAADAWLTTQAGFVQAWGDQSAHTLGTAAQLTTSDQPGLPKLGGEYQTQWAAHQHQSLSAPDNGNLSDLWTAGGYALFAVDMDALAGSSGVAALLTKGSWAFYMYSGSEVGLWLVQSGAGGQGFNGTGPLPPYTGRHIIELEYNSSAPANLPVISFDGVVQPIQNHGDYSGALLPDTGPLELGNSSLLVSGSAGFNGRLLELFAYKGTVAPADQATLRADVQAFYSTP